MSDRAKLEGFWKKQYSQEDMPFDADEPDKWIQCLAENGQIRGRVLDSGCGPGRNALYLSGLGFAVLGADISAAAIARAEEKARQKNLSVRFITADICSLYAVNNYFDTVIDIGCFHSLAPEHQDYYIEALTRLCRPGATLYLRAFCDLNISRKIYPDGCGWPAITESRIRTAFHAYRWEVKQIIPQKIDLLSFKGRVYAWLAEIQKE
ncbi:MAG: class I SAM-dependent methyltransferase [Candidatus Margulisbacteria bacterium]|jgi:SAM-dependent methyltransferase|nr:class I SAM-dependent methyltransferase [Candidatus Margulisiibacteriota bacterium]